MSTTDRNSVPEKEKINLGIYISRVSVPKGSKYYQTLHSNIIEFNDAFDKNLSTYNNVLTIQGCETPIYFVMDNDRFTFVCRSKVLRAYLFCLVVNYVFDRKYFRFDMMAEKFNFNGNLTDSRMKALENAEGILKRISNEVLLEKLVFNNYYFEGGNV